MELTEWKNRGRYFKHKGHQIFYREEGEGDEVLLLIHGFPTASWDWHKIWPSLLNKFRLIAPDLIGFGYSDKPKNYDYSIMDQADVVEGLVKELEIGKHHVLAHDYGDTVAQEYLARHEERVQSGENPYPIQSICFLNGGLFPEMHRPRFIQKLLLSPIGFLLNPFLTRSKLQSNFEAIFGPQTQPSAKEIDEFYALIMHNNGRSVMHKLIHYITDRNTYRDRWVSVLQTTHVPLKVIDGGFDPVSGKHMVALYRKLVPNPNVTLYENIGHYPQTEAPELVLKAYWEFMENVMR